MRLARLFTVLGAAVAVTAVLAAPASAAESPAPYIYPSYELAALDGPYIAPPFEPVLDSIAISQPQPEPVVDPLRAIRPLITTSIDADYLGSVGAVAIDASAITNSIYISGQPSYALRYYLDNNSSITSYCTYTRSGAGAGAYGSSVDFTVAGEATAYGRYKGVEIVATGVECTLYKPDMTIGTGQIWAPGSLSVATARRSSWDARGGYVCVQAWALLHAVPAGESSAIKTTGRTCFYV